MFVLFRSATRTLRSTTRRSEADVDSGAAAAEVGSAAAAEVGAAAAAEVGAAAAAAEVGGACGRGRGRRRRRTKRKRTEEEDAAATIEKARLEANRLDATYARKLELNLMSVVEDLMTHDHYYFLKDAEVTDSWDLEYTLDIDKVEMNQKQFYDVFAKFLSSLKHFKLKDNDGVSLGKLHGSLKLFITAVNNCFRDANRPVPSLFQLLCSKFMEAKRKDEKKLNVVGLVPDKGGREDMSFELSSGSGKVHICTFIA